MCLFYSFLWLPKSTVFKTFDLALTLDGRHAVFPFWVGMVNLILSVPLATSSGLSALNLVTSDIILCYSEALHH